MDLETARDALQEARNEILMLRRHNEELAPRAEAYDMLVAVITRLMPARSQGFGVDIAWKIETLLNGHEQFEPVTDEGA